MSYIVSSDMLVKPSLKFKDGKAESKYSILRLYPYELPRKTAMHVVSLTDHNVHIQRSDIDRIFTGNNGQFPFRGAAFTKLNDIYPNLYLTFEDAKESDLEGIADSHQDKIILAIHGGRGGTPNGGWVDDNIYYGSKIRAINNFSRYQFVSYDHIASNDRYQKFNLWTQLIAKSDGTPWIVDNSNIQFTNNDTFIVGIAFSILKGIITYGVAHFIDVNNMKQEVMLRPIGREVPKGSLYLETGELENILKTGISRFRDVSPNNSIRYGAPSLEKIARSGRRNLSIFIYKTTPLHHEEEAAIDDLISKSDTLGYDAIDVTHVHIKSENYGIPRIFDTGNYGSSYQYMNRQGTVIKILSIDSNNKGLAFRGDIIIGTTGIYDKRIGLGGTLGTPKPLLLSVHSTMDDPFRFLGNQIMAMSEMDWEYTGENYRLPFIIKYARRVSVFSHYIKSSKSFKPFIDIRDIM